MFWIASAEVAGHPARSLAAWISASTSSARNPDLEELGRAQEPELSGELLVGQLEHRRDLGGIGDHSLLGGIGRSTHGPTSLISW